MRNLLICDTPSLFNGIIPFEVEIIESLERFDQINWSDSNDINCVFVYANLKWTENVHRSDFFGFEVIRRLRLFGVLSPIFVFSWMQREYFLNSHTPIFQMLRIAFAHPFVQLPLDDSLTVSIIESAMPLSKLQLEDMKFHFFDTQGLLDEYIHHLKNMAGGDVFDKVEATVAQISALIPPDKKETYEVFKKQFLTKARYEKSVPYKLIVQFKSEIQQLLPARYLALDSAPDTHEWRVLLVDDNEVLLKDLVDRFKKNNIKAFSASCAEEAFRIIELDEKGCLEDIDAKKMLPANSITVIISDLRFIDEHGNWHPYQGYDIIKRVSEMSHIAALFVLTSKKGAILNHISKISDLRIHWYAKEDVLDSLSIKPFLIFSDKVRSEGNDMRDVVLSAPKAAAWSNPWDEIKRKWPLRDYYYHHRRSSTYHDTEGQIQQHVDRFLHQAGEVKLKNLKEINNVGFSCEFKANISGDPGDEASMEHFYNKLKGRRIALALHLEGWKASEISDILTTGKIGLRRPSSDKGLFSTHLALSSKIDRDIPQRLLVEERRWIKEHLGILI